MSLEKIKKLLESDKWPQAVDATLLCPPDDELEKKLRGKAIFLTLVREKVSGKKFLDFGCGEGHVLLAAQEAGAYTVGYDLEVSGDKTWESDPLLTTNWDKVVKSGPYDYILLYDVLDHADDPEDCLLKCKQVLQPKGKIYCRRHPFCSRHGGHLYHQLNKAFVQVVLSEHELFEMGYTIPVQRVYHPIAKCRKIFERVGLAFIDEKIERQSVERFFKENIEIKERIMQCWGKASGEEFPEFQMEQNFLDYTVKHA